MPPFKILIDGIEYEASREEALQDVAERVNADILFGCFSARCGVCRVRVVSGADHLSAMTELESELLSQLDGAPQERLACQCRLLGEVTLESHN